MRWAVMVTWRARARTVRSRASMYASTSQASPAFWSMCQPSDATRNRTPGRTNTTLPVA